MKNLGAVLVVRLKSKRLKNKAILKINKNESAIEYIIKKLKKIFKKEQLILATSNLKKDLPLVDISTKLKIDYIQRNAVDVLKRIYFAAIKKNFKDILVCTGDNPLVDLNSIKEMITAHVKNKNDFTYSSDMPVGSYGWVLKVKSLKKILLTKKKADTEIWGDFFLKNKSMKCGNYQFYSQKKKNIPMRLTLDTKEDLSLIKHVLNLSNTKFPNLVKIEKILLANKNILKINSQIKQKKKPKNIY